MNKLLDRRGFVKVATTGAALAMMPPAWSQGNRYDVIVVGAGLSGLHTTYLLEQQGLKVLLLESSHRVGGRVYTLDHLDARPDAGATQVGGNYDGLRNITERLGVPLLSYSTMPSMDTLSVRGHLLRAQDWSSHAANRLPEQERHIQPSFLLWKYLAETRVFADPANWLKDEYRYLDIPLDVHLKNLGASEEALRLMNSNFESNDLSEVSALHTVRKFTVIIQSRGAELVAGGTSRIPEAMAASLQAPPRLNKAVRSIGMYNNNLVVSCSDNSRYEAPRCVLAAPFSTLRKMDLQIEIREAKRQAIENLAYSHITQVFLRPVSDYWQEDKFSADMWTDSPIGMVTTKLDDNNKVVLLQVWLIGNNAKAVAGLSKSEIGKLVINNLESIRPSSKGKLLLEDVVNWGENPNSLGAYAHFHPGDIGRFATAIAEPEGPVYFVGEHTEFRKSGMEAAILSAERCARELLASL